MRGEPGRTYGIMALGFIAGMATYQYGWCDLIRAIG